MSLQKLKSEYDVIVVGGGINGCGILRDLALRGIDALLIEKGDFSKGTSWASSGMIHGGPRYLLNDKDVTRLSCLDSGFIQKIAPHLLFRIPFLYPVYQEKGLPKLASQVKLEAVEAFFESYDKFVPLKNGKKHTRLSPKDVLELEPDLPKDNLLGAVTFDEWGIDVPRLCIVNVKDAMQNGAMAMNHTEVISVNMSGQKFNSIQIRDVLSGEKLQVKGKILINATGPWSPEFAKYFGGNIKLRGGKGIHLVYDRRLFNMAISSQAIDGREIFIMPYENTTIIGTTDDDYFGNLDEQRSTEEEVAYLKEGIEQIFPKIKDAKLIYTYSGVRPTLYKRKVMEDDLSREHETIDHEHEDGLSGVVSVIGGKLASYRIMSEEVVDVVAKKLGNQKPCETHSKALPGGDSTQDVVALSQEYSFDVYAISRMIYRHGSLAKVILEEIKANPKKGALLCSCEPVTIAEAEYIFKTEQVRTVSDLRMRSRLSQGPCQGTQCLIGAAGFLQELVKNEKFKPLHDSYDFSYPKFLNEWWWNRAVSLNDQQIKQEVLNQAIHFCNNSLDLA